MAVPHIPFIPHHGTPKPARSGQGIVTTCLILLAAMMVLSLAMPTAAADESPTSLDTPRVYDIPAGPLNRVLNQFARTSGLFLGGAGNFTEGRSSPGLQSQYTPLAALAELLADTGLDYRLTDAGTLTLVQDGAETDATGPLGLEPLVVVSATRRATRCRS